MSISIMKQALEALETEQALRQGYSYLGGVRIVSTADEAINALRTAIQQAAPAVQAEVTDEQIAACVKRASTYGLPFVGLLNPGGTPSDFSKRFTAEILALLPERVPMTPAGRGDFTHPEPSVPRDDQIAALVNKVRDTARMFHDHQSLRERIAIELVPALKVTQEVKSDAERGRFLIEWLKRYGLLQAEFGQMGVGDKPESWWLLHAPWGIDKTRPFFGHGKTPEQAIDAAMLAAK